jgi:hypothetical protein
MNMPLVDRKNQRLYNMNNVSWSKSHFRSRATWSSFPKKNSLYLVQHTNLPTLLDYSLLQSSTTMRSHGDNFWQGKECWRQILMYLPVHSINRSAWVHTQNIQQKRKEKHFIISVLLDSCFLFFWLHWSGACLLVVLGS